VYSRWLKNLDKADIQKKRSKKERQQYPLRYQQELQDFAVFLKQCYYREDA
jgi:hypothetical protein